ncbi:glutamine amidotransferase-related protein [Thaumasiovibrio subtropicus]|uniref:glutamine amidotransferase-related protein n=1 Tax=Thaumasiovibrio subtropicus TaxID=1891207 RepID=UPI000B356917|nr:GMP synthase [Thaumasiovibrio subtropicus]
MKTPHIHFVIHEAFEGPGAIADWVTERGYQSSDTHLYNGEQLPKHLNDIDLVVVLGGPQSPSTTRQECHYFDAEAEKAFILAAIAAKRAVLGICLGAQLIGEALGARYAQSPHTEIGAFPLSLTESGLSNEFVAHFAALATVGHWHNDMPGLTEQAEILAHSQGCPRQLVAYSDRVFGFQCHLEFTPALIEGLIAASETELASKANQPFVMSPAALRQLDFSAMNQALKHFLDHLIHGV